MKEKKRKQKTPQSNLTKKKIGKRKKKEIWPRQCEEV